MDWENNDEQEFGESTPSPIEFNLDKFQTIKDDEDVIDLNEKLSNAEIEPDKLQDHLKYLVETDPKQEEFNIFLGRFKEKLIYIHFHNVLLNSSSAWQAPLGSSLFQTFVAYSYATKKQTDNAIDNLFNELDGE